MISERAYRPRNAIMTFTCDILGYAGKPNIVSIAKGNGTLITPFVRIIIAHRDSCRKQGILDVCICHARTAVGGCTGRIGPCDSITGLR